MFWRGVTFWRRRLQSFGGVWHFWRTVATFWRWRGILEKPLAVVWRGVPFLEGACSVLERQEAHVQRFGGAC